MCYVKESVISAELALYPFYTKLHGIQLALILMDDSNMADSTEMLSTRRSRRSTAGNR